MRRMSFMILLLGLLSFNQLFAQESLTLDESIKLALRNNNEIRNSELEIRAAEQIKNSALTNYFPGISAGGLQFQAEKSLMEMGLHGMTVGFMKEGTLGYINVTQPVFAGGRIIYGNKLAGLGKDVSLLKSKLTKDEVIRKTEEQYWQIISLEEKVRTIESYEEMLSSLLKQVEDAYHSGIVMKNDVLKVRLKRSEVLLNKSKLNNGIKLARMAFCQYLGLPLNSSVILIDGLLISETPKALYVKNSEVLKNRDEYRLLELSVKAEKYQTKITRGKYLPQAAIGASYQYLKFDKSEKRTLGMVYGTISVPISDWWGGSHELKSRRQKERIAENNLKDKTELLLLQMEKSWQDLNDAYTQYSLSEESKEQAMENMKVNQDSYDNGLVTVADLLEARTLLQQAEDQLTDAKAGYRIKEREYLQITGR
jgi:outer membrane protein TolC